MGDCDLKSKRAAFSLAELTLTLVIIGVIASLTITDLLPAIQDENFKTVYKSVYSDLSRAMKMASIDNAGNLSPYFDTIGAGGPHDGFYNLFKQYLLYSKSCVPLDAPPNNCYPQSLPKQKNGTYLNYRIIDDGGFVLNNGVQVLLQNAINQTPSYMILIDVNGQSGPNTIGRDQFIMFPSSDRLKPAGSTGDGYEGTCNTTGWGCAAEYLINK